MGAINWGRAILGAIVAEAAQVAAVFLWVAFYSHILDPGQPFEVYERYAAAAAPWVSIVAGMIVFYAASRWIARALPTALALFGLFVAIDVALIVAMSADGAGLPYVMIVASYLTKLAACWLGGRHARVPARLGST